MYKNIKLIITKKPPIKNNINIDILVNIKDKEDIVSYKFINIFFIYNILLQYLSKNKLLLILILISIFIVFYIIQLCKY